MKILTGITEPLDRCIQFRPQKLQTWMVKKNLPHQQARELGTTHGPSFQNHEIPNGPNLSKHNPETWRKTQF